MNPKDSIYLEPEGKSSRRPKAANAGQLLHHAATNKSSSSYKRHLLSLILFEDRGKRRCHKCCGNGAWGNTLAYQDKKDHKIHQTLLIKIDFKSTSQLLTEYLIAENVPMGAVIYPDRRTSSFSFLYSNHRVMNISYANLSKALSPP